MKILLLSLRELFLFGIALYTKLQNLNVIIGKIFPKRNWVFRTKSNI